MVTLAWSQDQDSHHISNFICFGALFLLLFKSKSKQKNKQKNTHFVITCFEKCVQMLLTIATSLGLQRRLLRAAQAPGQWVGLGVQLAEVLGERRHLSMWFPKMFVEMSICVWMCHVPFFF